MRIYSLLATVLIIFSGSLTADAIRQTKGDFRDAFRQLDVDLPTANVYRTASGAPGSQYWQQRADYKIKVNLDETRRHISASETITYSNRSPDTLRYIWLQLDQNRFIDNSLGRMSQTAKDLVGRTTWGERDKDVLSYASIARHQLARDIDYGFEIERVIDATGNPLEHTIIGTMMRIDLPQALTSGQTVRFSIDWSFNIVLQARAGGRGGYEHFSDNDTYIYFLAQWFPRLAAYTDYTGWQHKAFIGSGEFTLEFGNYDVEITVPDDHIVSATGVLQNPGQVLTSKQRRRLDSAQNKDKPVFIVTKDEALENEKQKSTGSKTWVFKADNVRDFAWASSRKFIWDAMIHKQNDVNNPEVLAMSFYPPEAEPIWSKYSTHAIAHTMAVYSRFSFPYPYPTSQSVNTWKGGGMEYPMMTFNGYRPEPFEAEKDEKDKDKAVENAPDETYSRRVKYGLIGVIIHEVGHNYFPMIVNSDERQWTWMDEGLNTFLQHLAELEWEEEFPGNGSHVNVLDYIPEYMVSEDQVPIMTNAESLLQGYLNAYLKPTAALFVLRETIMGRELFDFAFREYAQRWKFKRPTPADLFRTMEDASGIDLDWFWRGWFYSTDHVDIALTGLREYKVSTTNPEVELALSRKEYAAEVPETLAQVRNREEGRESYLEKHPELADFYNENDRFTPSNKDRNEFTQMLDDLEDWEYKALTRAVAEDDYIYFIDFENIGGLPTPLPLLLSYEDGSEEMIILPAEIWRKDLNRITKLLIRSKAISSVALDPRHQIADADFSNNHFPSRIEKSRIELYKRKKEERDLMRDMIRTLRESKVGEDGSTRSVPLIPSN